jgi:putative drug exporter of the RND superfamily
VSHRRLWFAAFGGAVVLALVGQSFQVGGRLETVAHVEGSEAEGVSRQLTQEFGSSFVHQAILVIQGGPSPDSKEGAQFLIQISTALQKVPGVSGTLSYVNFSDPALLGRNGGTYIIVGLSAAEDLVDAIIPRLRASAQNLRLELQGRYPVLKLEVTGETPINFDLRKINSADVRIAENRVVPIVLVLLLVMFASVIAAILPLVVGVLAVLMTLGAAAFLSRWWHLSILIQNIATILGLGLGIDYALLMVSRFRDALASGQSATQASETAAREAGRTLLISGSTVAIGFAALTMIPISDLRSIGVAGFLVASACVLLANWILPAILALLGTRIDVWRLPFLEWANPDSARMRQRWQRWSYLITAKPWRALLLVGGPLLLLATQALQMKPGLPRIDWLPRGAESVRALDSLDAMGRSNIVQSLHVILELPPGSEITTFSGWNAIRLLAAGLASDKRADRVVSLPSLLGGGLGPSFMPLLSAETRRSFARRDGRATLLELLPASGTSTSDLTTWVRDIRAINVSKLTEVVGARMSIGGLAALDEDYGGVIQARLPQVALLIVVGTLLALLAAFRSVAVAVKAIALNLLSVGAALGALVVVFQNGHGSAFFGIAAGTGAVFASIPILAFAIVFGLSMDYEVFLVARVLEARRSGLSEIEAIAAGVAKTGGLITGAAAIMLVVFAAFSFGEVLAIKMLGFTLAVAVLIDATLVRMVIGPALLCLGGDWNWWPWGLAGTKSAAAPGQRTENQTR